MAETKSHAAAEAEPGVADGSDTGSRVRTRQPRAEEAPPDAEERTRIVTYQSTLDGQLAPQTPPEETRATRRKLPGREMGWDEDDDSTYVYATLESDADEPLRAKPERAVPQRSALNAPVHHVPANAPQRVAAPAEVSHGSARSFAQPRTRTLTGVPARVANPYPVAQTVPQPHVANPRPSQLVPPPIAVPAPVAVPAPFHLPAPARVDRRAITLSTSAFAWLPQRSDPTLARKLTIAALALGAIVVVLLAARMLTSDAATSTVQLMTEPADAKVTLDGVRAHGSASPYVLSDVALHTSHTIVVSKAGYRSWSTHVTLHSSRSVSLPLVQLAHDSASSAPPIVATRYAAPSFPSPPPPVAPARTRARAPHSRALPATASPRSAVRSAPVAKAAPAARTRPGVAPASATLRINSRPWSQVYIDGRLVGSTPQMQIVLPAGVHTVTLVNPAFGLKRVIVQPLAPGQVVTKLVELAN